MNFAFSEWKKDVLESAAERFERRLTEEPGTLRVEVARMDSHHRLDVCVLARPPRRDAYRVCDAPSAVVSQIVTQCNQRSTRGMARWLDLARALRHPESHHAVEPIAAIMRWLFQRGEVFGVP